MTKKDNKHIVVRKVRRALNRVLIPISGISQLKMNRSGYGSGITKKSLTKHMDFD